MTIRFRLLDHDGLELFRSLMEGAASSDNDEPMTAAEWIADCDAEIDRRMSDDDY